MFGQENLNYVKLTEHHEHFPDKHACVIGQTLNILLQIQSHKSVNKLSQCCNCIKIHKNSSNSINFYYTTATLHHHYITPLPNSTTATLHHCYITSLLLYTYCNYHVPRLLTCLRTGGIAINISVFSITYIIHLL